MTPELPFDDFVAIVAPCPVNSEAREGWMSRIAAVDRIFEDKHRIYIDPYSGAPAGPPVFEERGPLVHECKVQLTRGDHHALLERIVLASRLVYVHTAHLGRFLLPFYPTGKIVTDMHGVVPEEERMLGRPAAATFYEGVERVILKNSRYIVVVTDAMRDHLLAKHPDSNATFICLPIIEKFPTTLDRRVPREPGGRYRAIYAGGTAVWQNIERTLEVCNSAHDIASFEFLSTEHETIRGMAAGMSFVDEARFGVVGKAELGDKYRQSDLGFVLRDDTAVNRVSCPTKLSEYLAYGVIPVVKTPNIGDFRSEGYAYVTDEEFIAGLIPDEATCDRMRRTNRAVLDRLSARFGAAAAILSDMQLPNMIWERDSLAGLPIGDRHLLFPSHAELYVFTDVMHHFVRDVIDFYDEMTWQPDVDEPAAAIRVIPLLGGVIAELLSIELLLDGSPPAGFTATCAATARRAGAALVFTPESPYVDVSFSRKLRIRDIRLKWRFHTHAVDAEKRTAAPVEIIARDAGGSGAQVSTTASIVVHSA